MLVPTTAPRLPPMALQSKDLSSLVTEPALLNLSMSSSLNTSAPCTWPMPIMVPTESMTLVTSKIRIIRLAISILCGSAKMDRKPGSPQKAENTSLISSTEDRSMKLTPIRLVMFMGMPTKVAAKIPMGRAA